MLIINELGMGVGFVVYKMFSQIPPAQTSPVKIKVLTTNPLAKLNNNMKPS